MIIYLIFNYEKNKSPNLGYRRQKGFTLIEILVVIAIINILSTVVLVVLNGAKDKATEARVKSQLKSMNSQALLYTGQDGSPFIDFSASPAEIIGASNGSLFTNITPNTGSLYNLLSKLPGDTTIYYGWDGKILLMEEGGLFRLGQLKVLSELITLDQ